MVEKTGNTAYKRSRGRMNQPCLKFISIIIISFICSQQAILSQCIDTVDFTTWTEVYYGNNWRVDSPTKVTENAEIFPVAPSFFVSDNVYINIRFSFDVVSMNGLDNDFIGLVAGYRNPFTAGSSEYEFLLMDWKAQAETAFSNYAKEGFTLSAFHGVMNPSSQPDYFWGHNGMIQDAVYDPLMYNYGDTKGWETGRKYHFDVFYMATSIKIYMDDNLLFDAERCNQAGRIGFYTYSQHNVIFSNLSIRSSADFFASPEKICAGDTVFSTIINSTCPGYIPTFDSWEWLWGDGEMTSGLAETYHVYADPGNYTLELQVQFPGSCRDTLTTQISVQAPPSIDLGADTTVTANSTIVLSTGDYHPEWTYQWSTGSDQPRVTLENLTSDTAVSLTVTGGLCTSYDTIRISIADEPPLPAFYILVPNAFTPNGDGLNDVFLPKTQSELPYNFQMYIYDRWGTEIFRTANTGMGWDGKFNGQECPGDIYIYLVKYQPGGLPQPDSFQTLKGCFILLR
jgi:gliding motility-associated-like protein